MMMAMEATSTVLDRSLEKLKTTPRADEPRRASMADKWAMRRWSLRGTADTRAKSTPPPPPPQVSPSPILTAQSETETEKRKRSRSVDLSPLQTSLKKAPTVITAKLAQCVESLGFRDALHRYKSSKKHADDDDVDHPFPHHPHHDSKDRRVHFPSSAAHFKQVFERPETTAEEKAQYHYSRQELTDMVIDAKHSLARETRFSAQPDSTILEQGFLTLPNELHFFHHKRYYCLLKARELLCFASPAHAAKQTHVKCKIPILKVQECSTMSAQAKIAAFGAHLPTTMSLLFFVTRADGERVLLAAETRSSKKNWVHILQRLTQVHEAALPACVVRQTSSTSTCTSEDDSNNSLCSSDDEEEKCETPETNEREENKADEKAAAREGCCDCHHTEEPVCCQ